MLKQEGRGDGQREYKVYIIIYNRIEQLHIYKIYMIYHIMYNVVYIYRGDEHFTALQQNM